MDTPLLRVDLSADATDFELLAVEPGVALVDKWNATGSLLGTWLGRFAAEPVWEGETLAFFLRDDDGNRVARASCRPATKADVEGNLGQEMEELQNRLRRAVPQSSGAHAIHRFVSRGLISDPPGSGFVALGCQFFKYQDVQGDWRLVWCYGYQPVEQRESVRAVVCDDPECRRLALVERPAEAKCSRCQNPLLAPKHPPARPRKRLTVVLLLLLLLAAAGGYGVYAYLRPSAVLIGRVVCAADQSPVAGARVAIEGTSLECQSDAGGEFRLAGAPGGTATVFVTAPGFQPESTQAELASRAETSIEVKLRGASRLAGKVVYAADPSLPVAGAEVRLETIAEALDTTDEKGEFELSGLPPLPMHVLASAKGFRVERVAAEPGASALSIPLAGDAVLAGEAVRGDTNQPVANAQVRLAGTPFAALSGPDGRFRIEGVCSGPAEITASAPGLAGKVSETLTPDGQATVRIVLHGTVTLSGRVVSAQDKTPIEQAEVVVAQSSRKATTDAAGQFTLAGLEPSMVVLRVAANGYQAQEIKKMLADGSQKVDDVALTPAPAPAEFSGTVLSAVDKTPIEGAEITVAGAPQPVRTGRGGAFAVSGVPSGPTTIDVAAPGFRPRRLQPTLTPGPQKLAEIILDGAIPVAGVTLNAKNRDRPVAKANLEVRVAGSERALVSEKNGGFTVGPLPPCLVQITARAPGYRETRVQKRVSPKDAWIEVAMEPLPPAFAASGVVVNANNRQQAVAAATVEVTAGDQRKSLTSEPNGGFSLGELHPCLVQITARAPGYRETRVQKRVSAADPWIEVAMEPLPPPPPPVQVSGVVVDASDKQRAIANAALEVTAGDQRRPLTSEANGGFSVGVVPAGPVRVIARAQGYRETHVSKTVSAADPWIEVAMEPLITARGIVYDAATSQPIAGANVRVSVDGVEQSVVSRENGGFTVAVPAGQAEVEAEANGFCEAHLAKRITKEDPVLQVPMALGTTVAGTVINAVNNQPVPDASVEVEVNGVRRSGFADAAGKFEIREVPAGNGVIEVSAPDFEAVKLGHQSGGSGALRVVLSPKMPRGEVRIVLIWGASPPDLDAHLYGPRPSGPRFHIYHEKRKQEYATLDVDAVGGHGPETITMRAVPGRYQYFVTHPENLKTTDGSGLARSSAQVRVYYNDTGTTTQQTHVLSAPPTGPAWHVFDIVVDEARKIAIVPRNAFYQGLPAQ